MGQGTQFIGALDVRGTPALFTSWSAVHFAAGVALESVFRDVRAGAWWAFGLHTVYEVKDYLIFASESGFMTCNTPFNSVGDTLAFAAGYGTAVKGGSMLSPVAAMCGYLCIHLVMCGLNMECPDCERDLYDVQCLFSLVPILLTLLLVRWIATLT